MMIDLPFILASASSEIPTEYPTWGEAGLYLLGIAFFLLLNAFFVASEFAIVKVRPGQIEGELESKPKRAGIAKFVVGNLDGYLSANQLGITIASLALPFLGEPFIKSLVAPSLVSLDLSEKVIKGISYTVAMGSFTFLHVVIGELLPKSIAIRKSLGTTLVIARPLHIFYWIFRPVIFILNGTANFLLKNIFKIDPVSEGEAVHSSEELAMLVEQSEREQEVTETEREILINALELNDISVKDVMTPRSEVVFLDIEKGFPENLEFAIKATHTRFPLVKGHLDETLGLIHIKDVLKLMNEDDKDLLHIKREIKVVPEIMKLDDLLKFFLTERVHLALVVDEFGDPAGLVFMDNIMTELVGNIQDEFDVDEATEFRRHNADEFTVEGGLTLNELSDHEPSLDLDSGEVSTIAGYIVQQLGHLPEAGEKVEVEGFEATVTRADDRRIEELTFMRLPEPDGKEEEA
jgi:CBS domain containing-hemolysin-like protein|tara:strand:- start:614 stop:2005 length:1392 start_codon:yes stop_codon:yes gene_type:complete